MWNDRQENPNCEVAIVKDLLQWFGLFLLTTLILGWAQIGLCWIFCELVAGDQKYFWPFMGLPMTFNMIASFALFGKMDTEGENEC